MKYMAVGSSMFAGNCAEKMQVCTGGSIAAPASTDEFTHPLAPKEFPGAGVPKAVRRNSPEVPFTVVGPTVVKGFQRPNCATLGSSLKFPCRISAVGTV